MSVKNLGFPHLSLEQCLEKTRQIYDQDRLNPIDRLSAANHLGYSSLSGASDKMLATLVHYGLIEKSGKGEIRVSQLAQDIFTPESEGGKLFALQKAANSPQLFDMIDSAFPTAPSETSLKNWLIRNDFVDRVILSVMKAYFRTNEYLKQEGVFESDGPQGGEHANLSETKTNQGADMESVQQSEDTVIPITSEKNKISMRIEETSVSLNCQNLNRHGLKVLIKKLTMAEQMLALSEGINEDGDEDDDTGGYNLENL